MAVQTQIQMRRGSAATWTATNPILAAGEIGFESDTNKFKIGNGSSTWAALAYAGSAMANTYVYTATAGQTTFSGADSNGNTLAYTVGAQQVYLNGVLLVQTTDYTATNGTSVVLASGAVASDILTVVAYSAFSVSSDIPKSTLTDKGSLVTATAASTPANLSVGANDQVLVADSTASSGLAWKSYGAQVMAGKNAVINGGFDIWQRGTSVVGINGIGAYTADRWFWYVGTQGTVSRQSTNDTTNLPFIQYCARVQRNNAETQTGTYPLYYNFETVNSIPFAGKTVTMSFYARKGANYSPTSSLLDIAIYSGTGTDQKYSSGYTGSATVGSSSVTLTTTWQRFTLTGAVGATATELSLAFSMNTVGTAGAADYFEITGVQLELGSTATPFSRAGGTIQGELAACQRYYFRQSATATSVYQRFSVAAGANSTTTWYGMTSLPVTLRANTTSLDYSLTGMTLWDGSNFIAVTGLSSAGDSAQNSQPITATTAGSLVANRAYTLVAQGSSSPYLGINAEL